MPNTYLLTSWCRHQSSHNSWFTNLPFSIIFGQCPNSETVIFTVLRDILKTPMVNIWMKIWWKSRQILLKTDQIYTGAWAMVYIHWRSGTNRQTGLHHPVWEMTKKHIFSQWGFPQTRTGSFSLGSGIKSLEFYRKLPGYFCRDRTDVSQLQ